MVKGSFCEQIQRPVSTWSQSNKQTNKQRGTLRNKEMLLLTIRPSLCFPPRTYRLPSLGSGRKPGLKRQESHQYNVSFSQDFVSSCCVPAVSLLKTNVFIRPVLYRHSLSLSHYVTHSSLFTLTLTARWLFKNHSGIEPLQAVALFFYHHSNQRQTTVFLKAWGGHCQTFYTSTIHYSIYTDVLWLCLVTCVFCNTAWWLF